MILHIITIKKLWFLLYFSVKKYQIQVSVNHLLKYDVTVSRAFDNCGGSAWLEVYTSAQCDTPINKQYVYILIKIVI